MLQIENYKIYQLNDLSNQEYVDRLKDTLASIPIKEYKGGEVNYLYAYKDTSGNLFRILDEGRFKSGAYYLITDNEDNFVVGTGWHMYQHEEEGEVAILCSRSILATKYRNTTIFPTTIQPPIIEQIKLKKPSGKIWQTFNGRTARLINIILHPKYLDPTHKAHDPLYWKTGAKFNYIGKRTVFYTEQEVIEFQY